MVFALECTNLVLRAKEINLPWYYISWVCKNNHATNLGKSFDLLISILIAMNDMEFLWKRNLHWILLPKSNPMIHGFLPFYWVHDHYRRPLYYREKDAVQKLEPLLSAWFVKFLAIYTYTSLTRRILSVKSSCSAMKMWLETTAYFIIHLFLLQPQLCFWQMWRCTQAVMVYHSYTLLCAF